ncbi:sll0787 family AIR synthase-like protein (plasmid) [Erwinia sp. INIA-01]|uniref:sll0787 family AIR synthase-like protein n=1 Tax=Erwinia sp. INIA01 TaxID=2991500 RepID=UPI0022243A64|nr:sll0787 family AIR synthase-like protein [Erwinia sp. INIA01]MCW1872983.1 sll0787 family AIR synthase-like protein [Erwinia sp. INIA01]
MMENELTALISRLHTFSGLAHKQDIQPVAQQLREAWPCPCANGDDCALIPDGEGYKLLAMEGFINRFVAEDPWFAGWCGVMVNLSDIAAMGGRPLAIVNALWDDSLPHAGRIVQGMAAASRAYQVPIVGGHTNLRCDRPQLAVAVLGETRHPLSSFLVQPGQALMVAINLQGRWHPPGHNWDAATEADPAALRHALALLPELAASGRVHAAKDISQAGLAGTLVMMLESAGVGAEINLAEIPIPPQVDLEQWLCAFPSFGFLLAVEPEQCSAVQQQFNSGGIACARVGHFTADKQLMMQLGQQRACYWDLDQQPLTGMSNH